MTNIYNVHIYREMKLRFDGIKAATLEAAAAVARDKPTDEADDIDDCEGKTLAALVDLVGDEEYEHSRIIDFESEQPPNPGSLIITALQMASNYMSDDLDEGDETEMHIFSTIRAALAQAVDETPTSGSRTLTIEVRAGVVQDVSNVPPRWDYEIIDHDSAE
jgi:hypothetical protein